MRIEESAAALVEARRVFHGEDVVCRPDDAGHSRLPSASPSALGRGPWLTFLSYNGLRIELKLLARSMEHLMVVLVVSSAAV